MSVKTISVCLVVQVLLVVFLSVSPIIVQTQLVRASPETVVAVVPSNVSASVDQSISVNITIFDVQNIYGLEVSLGWNSSIVQLIGIDDMLGQPGGVLNPPVFVAENSTQESGYVIAATSTIPALPFNGTGNVAEMTFKIVGVGDSELDLNATLQDYPPPDRNPPVSLPIDHATVSGIVYGVVPEFLGYSLVIVLIVVAVVAVIFARDRHRRLIRRRGSNRMSWSER